MYIICVKKIANILTKSTKSFEPYFNVVKDESNLISGMPTLIVGIDNAKRLCPKFNILQSEVEKDSLYWTFGRTEKREKNEIDIENFKKLSKKLVLKSVSYKYVSLLLKENSNFVDFFKNINNIHNKQLTVYVYNGMLYLTNNTDGCVYGFSIADMEYLYMDINDIKLGMQNNKCFNVISNDLSIVKTLQRDFTDNIYLIPYLL